jgi:hypothetical protein
VKHWFDSTRQQFQKGEAVIANGVSALLRGWTHPAILPAIVLDKLCTGADRWQRAVRETQAPLDMAAILRARTICGE